MTSPSGFIKVHKENQEIYKLFTLGDWMIACIKIDTDWYPVRLQGNPPPPGLEL